MMLAGWCGTGDRRAFQEDVAANKDLGIKKYRTGLDTGQINSPVLVQILGRGRKLCNGIDPEESRSCTAQESTQGLGQLCLAWLGLEASPLSRPEQGMLPGSGQCNGAQRR